MKAWIFCVFLLNILPISVRGIRCGVCSSAAGETTVAAQFPSFKGKFPKCGTASGEAEQPLALDCPRDSQAGCLTITEGTEVSKMCSNIPVQDCKTANGLEYCYCRGELCNLKQQPQQQQQPIVAPPVSIPTIPPPTPPTHTQHDHINRFDDEDDVISGMEGSGSGTIKITTLKPKQAINTTPKSTTKQQKPTTNSANCLNVSKLIIIFISYISHSLY